MKDLQYLTVLAVSRSKVLPWRSRPVTSQCFQYLRGQTRRQTHEETPLKTKPATPASGAHAYTTISIGLLRRVWSHTYYTHQYDNGHVNTCRCVEAAGAKTDGELSMT